MPLPAQAAVSYAAAQPVGHLRRFPADGKSQRYCHATMCRSANQAFTDQEWQLNHLMKETLLTFLTRIAFLLGDSNKDPDGPVLLTHTLGLLDDALALFHNVPVKMSFLNRMLEANLQNNVDPPPSLIIGAVL
jgi:hypothetical protein